MSCHCHHWHYVPRPRRGHAVLGALAWLVAEYWLLAVTGLAVLLAVLLRLASPDQITMSQLPKWHLWIIDLKPSPDGTPSAGPRPVPEPGRPQAPSPQTGTASRHGG
jgi:hypothetical protein